MVIFQILYLGVQPEMEYKVENITVESQPARSPMEIIAGAHAQIRNGFFTPARVRKFHNECL